jgi:replicative DNA helicase
MAGFSDTMELERSLLSIMLKSKVLLRQFANKIKPEYFTTRERKFIRECIVKTMKNTKGLLSKNIFEYEVNSRIEDKERPFYESEWTLIEGTTATDDVEVLLDRLHKAQVGRQLMDIAETMVTAVEKGDIDNALRQLRNSTSKITEHKETAAIVELTDYQKRLDLIRDKQQYPEKYLGIKIGFKTFDERTGGLFPGELTLASGITGLGKSTFLKQVETGIILCNQNKNVLHICNEEHLMQVSTKFDAQMTQIPYKNFKVATITDEEIEKWRTTMEITLKKPGTGRIFIKEVPAFSDITLIEEALVELENQGIKIHVVIIDHLPHLKPVEQAWGEYDEQGKAAADCKELARSWHIAVVTATQAATVVDAKQSKGRKAGDMDVFGSKKQLHVTNTHISITKIGTDDKQTDLEEWQRDVYWLGNLTKNRDGAKFVFKMKHHVQFGYVEEFFDKLPPKTEEEMKRAIEEGEKALEEDRKAEEEKKGEKPEDKPEEGQEAAPADKPAEKPVPEAPATVPDHTVSQPEATTPEPISVAPPPVRYDVEQPEPSVSGVPLSFRNKLRAKKLDGQS